MQARVPQREGLHPQDRSDFALILLLLLINVLNLGDLAFTFLALRAGYAEANPFMQALFLHLSPIGAGLVKLAIGVAFTLAAWVLRDRRGMTAVVTVVLGVYFVLFIFHVYVTLAMV